MNNPNEKSGGTAPEKKASVIERCPCGAPAALVLVRLVAATASASRTSSGPARVTSEAFREGWDGINWGAKVGAA